VGMVLANAKVYTCADDVTSADAVVVEDGAITFVGDLQSWENAAGLPVYDLGGRTVVPGLIDSHTHPSMVAQSFWHVRLPWTTDVDEILDFIRDYAQAHPRDEAPFL